jgi:fatty-acyl-CoA synthase
VTTRTASDALRVARVAARSRLWQPRRPDRWVGAALALRRFGNGLAGAVSSAASLYGRDTAVVDPERTLTFSELEGHSNALAHALVNHGIGRGSVVGMLARNHAGFLEAAAGVAKTGADLLLLNTEMAAPQLRDVCAREHAGLVIHDDDLADRFEEAGGVRVMPMSRVADLASTHTTAALPSVPPGRTIILTSGTTGTPKGAERDVAPRQLATAVAALGLFDTIPYRGGDTMLVAAPLFHAWGYAHATIGLTLGCTTVLRPRFDAEATVATIAERRVHVLVAVPVMLTRLLALPESVRAELDTSSLRLVPLSGSALPNGLAAAFMDAFGDVLYNLYGSTEVGSVTIATPADLRDAPGTAGRAVPGIELRIVDDEGRPLAAGERGHIAVHSPLTFEQYTDGTSRRAVDGYMLTGDTGHLDAADRLFVDGRDDDMIVSGGENVYPSEIEHLLESHPDVADVAVVGVDDPDFGARLHAYVVRTPTGEHLDADAVRDYVRAHLARFKVPRDVTFLDTLPRNAAGKVVKRELPTTS